MLAGSETKASAEIVGDSGAVGMAGEGPAAGGASVAAERDAPGLRAPGAPSRRPYLSIQARSVFRVMRSATAVCEMFQ